MSETSERSSNEDRPVTVGDASDRAIALAEEAAAKATSLATALSASLTELSGKLTEERAYGRANRKSITAQRKIIIALVVSLLLDVTLSVATIFLAVSLTNQNSANIMSQAKQATVQKANQIAACQAGNVTKKQVIGLWTENIRDFHNTSEGAAFLKRVNAVYAPINCQKTYGGG
jgi:hypothetical protein